MRDILPALRRWYDGGAPVGLATVVGVSESAPRQPGATMAVGPDGEVVGSVSGGCVEGAVFELAQEVLSSGVPSLQTYGISDEDAFAVGLTCGGVVSVFVEPVDKDAVPALGEAMASIETGQPVAVATVISGPARPGAKLAVWADRAAGTLGTEGLDAAVTDDARGMLSQGSTGQRHYGPHGERRVDEVTVFLESFAPRPRMLVFGAIDFAAAVVRVGALLGYHVTVCDARPVFATRARFPDADEVVVQWPHRYLAGTAVDERAVICVLTHDPKFDVPLLEVALRTPAAYVGAMGSRRTHDDRLARLREAGLTEADLARLRSPIGLDLGARTPEETAVSIAAEIVQCRWGGSGSPLSETDGRIHHDPGALGRPRRDDPRHRSPPGHVVTGPPSAAGDHAVGVAGILLAAGPGSRLGRPKALVRLGSSLLVERGHALLSSAGCSPVVVVLGAAAEEVRAVADLDGAQVLVNADWSTGMGSSLRVGLAALDASVPAAVVALADQPLVGPVAVRRLMAAWREGAVAAVATYGGAPRNPVLLDRSTWPEVTRTAVGDVGARAFLRDHPDLVRRVPCDGTGFPDDLDTADDLTRLEERCG